MLEIGINTNNESGKDYIEILKNIKEAGFKNVMLSYKTVKNDDVLKIINDLKLNVCYYHINNAFANDLWVIGDSADKYIQDVIKEIEFCGRNKIPIAIMHATEGSPTEFALKPNANGLNNFKKILEIAKKNNVKIALENLDVYSIKHLEFLLDNISDKSLGFCYDIGHYHLANLKRDLLKKYGNRLLALHIHDNLMDWYPGHDYTRDLHLLPFDGKINFEKVCAKLKGVDFKGIVMLEIHKIAFAQPQMYKNLDNLEYLKEAHKRAENLKILLEKKY